MYGVPAANNTILLYFSYLPKHKSHHNTLSFSKSTYYNMKLNQQIINKTYSYSLSVKKTVFGLYKHFFQSH